LHPANDKRVEAREGKGGLDNRKFRNEKREVRGEEKLNKRQKISSLKY